MTEPRPFPLGATLATAIAIVFLCLLGHWQQERLIWKNDLQAQLDREFAKDAAAIPLDRSSLTAVDANHPRRGTLTGRFSGSASIALSGQIAAGTGAIYILRPFATAGQTVFVVLGSLPAGAALPKFAPSVAAQTITGTARLPSWNRFTPPNEPQKNIWYRADPVAMAQTLSLAEPSPILFYADPGAAQITGGLDAIEIAHELRNDHAQYAVFWYTMAAILLIMYWLRFWRKTPRAAEPPASG